MRRFNDVVIVVVVVIVADASGATLLTFVKTRSLTRRRHGRRKSIRYNISTTLHTNSYIKLRSPPQT